jgi:NADH-quinone oxidoreductase subunit M
MNKFPILSSMIAISLVGFLFTLITKKGDEKNPKILGLVITVINLIVSLSLYLKFDNGFSGYQFIEKYPLLEKMNLYFHLGVDGIALTLIVLTNFLMPLVILQSWFGVKEKSREYVSCILILQSLMIGVFSSLNLFLFYIFFEAILIPMFFLIGIWGGANRIDACFKFFLFTFFGSIFMLVGIIKIYLECHSADLAFLSENIISDHLQLWLFLCFTLAFAIKTPMFPFHIWLPKAHVEAPTGGSVLLAGVLLKMGTYGLIRVCLQLFPHACKFYQTDILILSVVAIIYGAILAFAQKDIKKLVAYSSVSHMGIVTLGIFSLNIYGLSGACVQIISHGITSAGLFFCVGMIYERFHTRDISDYGGLIAKMPFYSWMFLFIVFGSIAVPATSGFVGEFLCLIGCYKSNSIFVYFAVLGVILSAVYMLFMYYKVFFGKISTKLGIDFTQSHESIVKKLQLNIPEIIILISVATVILLIGIYPKFLLGSIEESCQKITLFLRK